MASQECVAVLQRLSDYVAVRERRIGLDKEIIHSCGTDGDGIDLTLSDLRAAIDALRRQGEWIPVSDRLPETCRAVLLCVEVAPSGKRHVIRAHYAARNTLELGDEQEWWPGCTTDENENVYCPEGWYEQNQYDETSWHVADKVIAWQTLPQPPTGEQTP